LTVAKKLITEACVRAMPDGGVLHVGGSVIATPAALDLAHDKGVRVAWGTGGANGTGVASGTGAASTAAPQTGSGMRECLWHAMLASDGTYVVRVVNGQAVVDRLEDSGPMRFGTDSKETHGR
jgi:hypothetical protein